VAPAATAFSLKNAPWQKGGKGSSEIETVRLHPQPGMGVWVQFPFTQPSVVHGLLSLQLMG
jgi:hypothetical protein